MFSSIPSVHARGDSKNEATNCFSITEIGSPMSALVPRPHPAWLHKTGFARLATRQSHDSLVGQTLLRGERVWSNSLHQLVSNTPRISWCVN